MSPIRVRPVHAYQPFDAHLQSLSRLTFTGKSLQIIRVNAGETAFETFTLPAFGFGSVTSVSVVTANGVSGSVADPATTPAITLTLGNITPASVAAVGTVTGSNLSGTNTGDQDLSAYATTAAVAAGYQPLDAQLTSLAGISYTGNALKLLRINAAANGFEVFTLVIPAGDALTADSLAQFAATTSAELAGVITDETGTGALVFATSPTLVTPILGAATATTINGVSLTGSGTLATGTFTLTVAGTASISGTNTGDQDLSAYATTAAVAAGYQPLDGDLTSLAGLNPTAPDAQKYIRVNGGGTGYELAVMPAPGASVSSNLDQFADVTMTSGKTLAITDNTILAGGTHSGTNTGDVANTALTTGTLSQFAATTSAQLAGVLSDETGSGAAVFATSPTLVTPILGTPTSGNLKNCSNVPRILYAQYNGSTGTGAGEQTILTYTLPANTLSTNKILRIRYAIRRTTGTGSVIVTTKWAGTRLDAETARTTANWRVDATLWASGATNTQRSEVHTQSYTSGTVTNLCGVNSYTVDTTADADITIRFTLTTSTDVMTLDYAIIELLDQPA